MAGAETNSSKFIIVVRHGELDNPKNIVYNRDSLMKPEDIIHLSARGEEQMRKLGLLIAQEGFRVVRILVSPETRVQESVKYLTAGNPFPAFETVDDLDDAYVPGPYLTGMTMNQLIQQAGNTYGAIWRDYHHERPQGIATRMRKVFDEIAKNTGMGESSILISHGDPISWLLNDVIKGYLPEPEDLRNSLYPEKGVASVLVLDSRNKLINHYKLNPQDAGSKY